ncbi:hypothetical protein, variant [Fonticula alba]|uniref:ABC transporter domain-containing protein n=1 Tax=Fonticula alba TaxID=691883 RepID=A0A058Z1M7_FONAL|nr:hypothetical protein, variant [Fonticula alba]KCV67838.1 hypothetical protein, variant [Fonticula alba]|eukprot:XP_009497658.1 hypothetical protein, variant [Fonticula alba]
MTGEPSPTDSEKSLESSREYLSPTDFERTPAKPGSLTPGDARASRAPASSDQAPPPPPPPPAQQPQHVAPVESAAPPSRQPRPPVALSRRASAAGPVDLEKELGFELGDLPAAGSGGAATTDDDPAERRRAGGSRAHSLRAAGSPRLGALTGARPPVHLTVDTSPAALHSTSGGGSAMGLPLYRSPVLAAVADGWDTEGSRRSPVPGGPAGGPAGSGGGARARMFAPAVSALARAVAGAFGSPDAIHFQVGRADLEQVEPVSLGTPMTPISAGSAGPSAIPARMDIASSLPVTPMSTKSLEKASGEAIQAVRLSWNDIVHRVVVNKSIFRRRSGEEKVILDRVSGMALPGRVLAIMGPSGGGKTSLLDAVSGRLPGIKGQVLVNGAPLPKNFRRVSSYVMQDDLMFTTLSPREQLTFAARVRLAPSLTSADIAEHVEILLDQLSLTRVADTLVGRQGARRGLSGGERKRTAIAYEMITNPSLLFLDEPTSGLDSFTAFSLLEVLKNLAREGRTIVTTIHQPSSDIFAMFDDLVLLSRGRVAYFGEAALAVDYFSKIGYECPTYTNPSDFFMKVLHSHSAEDVTRVQHITATFEEQSAPQLRQEITQQTHRPGLTLTAPQRATTWVELVALTGRSNKTFIRNPVTFWARMAQTALTALMVGALFWRIELTQSGALGRSGALFFLITSLVMSSAMSFVLTFPVERSILLREQMSEMYSTTTYYWSKFLRCVRARACVCVRRRRKMPWGGGQEERGCQSAAHTSPEARALTFSLF